MDSSNCITLSIVSHGHGPLLTRLLEDLQLLPLASRAHIIVTLNAPGETFDTTCFPALHLEVIRNTQPQGFGANHNAAFKHCRTEWFAVLNPDLRLPQDPFPTLLQAAARYPHAALLAPRVLGADGTPEDAVRANLTPLSLLTRHGLQKRKALQPSEPACRGRRFYWLAGMFMLLRSTAYRAVGGFDERFFLYCEDYDLCARLYLAGNAIMLVEQASVIHEAQRDSRRSSKHLRWHLQSLGRVWRSRAFWRVLSSNLVQRSNIPNC